MKRIDDTKGDPLVQLSDAGFYLLLIAYGHEDGILFGLGDIENYSVLINYIDYFHTVQFWHSTQDFYFFFFSLLTLWM